MSITDFVNNNKNPPKGGFLFKRINQNFLWSVGELLHSEHREHLVDKHCGPDERFQDAEYTHPKCGRGLDVVDQGTENGNAIEVARLTAVVLHLHPLSSAFSATTGFTFFSFVHMLSHLSIIHFMHIVVFFGLFFFSTIVYPQIYYTKFIWNP